MILSSFAYKEQGWELTELSHLQSVNLLVARNATGKTRTIKALQNVTSFLQMKQTFMNIRSFEATLKFGKVGNPDWKMDQKKLRFLKTSFVQALKRSSSVPNTATLNAEGVPAEEK